METKDEIRSRLLAHRMLLSPEAVETASRRVWRSLFDLNVLEDKRCIALYSPFRNEIGIQGLFSSLQAAGKTLYFPRIEGQKLKFIEVDRWSKLKLGTWGILEPPPGGREEALERLEVVVVPGVAFDEEGYRLGFGKGYYDRTLANFRGIMIGLAYDFQIVPSFLREKDDLQCHVVLTEDRVISGRGLWKHNS